MSFIILWCLIKDIFQSALCACVISYILLRCVAQLKLSESVPKANNAFFLFHYFSLTLSDCLAHSLSLSLSQWKLWTADIRYSIIHECNSKKERLTFQDSVQWRTSCLFGYEADKHLGSGSLWDPSWLPWEYGTAAKCNLQPRPQTALWSAAGTEPLQCHGTLKR